MTVGPHDVPRAARPTRRQAALLLLLLSAVALALRAWELRFGLPLVLHSDHVQVEQAVELLRSGGFADRAPYPLLNVLILAALDASVGAAGLWTGLGAWTGWAGFEEALARPELSHTIARGWSAVAAALLAPAAYRLARVGLERGPALLAAASAALCPVAVATAHQARVHAPGITLLVLAAVPALRLVQRPTAARAALAGAAAGVAASLLQLGLLLGAATTLQLLVVVRPWPRALRLVALQAAALAATALLLHGLAHLLADVRPGGDKDPSGNLLTLGIPGVTLGWHWAQRAPRLLLAWIGSEPLRAALALLCVIATVAGARPRRALLLFGAYPALLLLVLGSNYTQPRYALSATPFLAALAALGLASLPHRALRAAGAVLLVAAPLLSSLRYDALLSAGDTRLRLVAAAPALSAAPGPVLVEDRLLPHGAPVPSGVRRFPEGGNFLPWMRGETTREASFAAVSPVLFVREQTGGPRLGDEVVRGAGLQHVATLQAGALESSPLPDPTERMALDVWRARRCGPTIELWARPGAATEIARRFVER